MAELLLEILCEEIPARMQRKAEADLARLMNEALGKAGLSADKIQSFSGPRRLVFVADIPARSPDISEERKGPRVGSPEQALAGFMRGAGLTDIGQAETRSDKKGDYYVAVINKAGRDSHDIIADIVPDIMGRFPWPKSMKSGASPFRWVRPLSSIICLLDGKIVLFTAGEISSGNQTRGHRRHGAGPFTVTGFADYKTQIEGTGHIILSASERAEKILNNAKALCKNHKLELVEDAGLLAEVSGLVEWPVILLGDMDKRFLKLPEEVIRLTLKSHQKTFTVRDPKSGKLAPHFLIVANQMAPDGGAAIKAGNAKVISARLSDAEFFQSEDAKQSLESYYDKLGTVVFHKKLGSIKDKAKRVTALSRELASLCGADPDKAEHAARLAKCDLVTQTVVEFTSLQGQIGRLMYEREGGEPNIALAIEQHYKPQGPSDAVPAQPLSVAVALADKLDTLVGFWAIDEKPTGSKDPYALRRAALGVVRIVLDNKVRLDLSEQLLKGWAILEMDNLKDKSASGRLSDGVISKDERSTLDNLLAFILDRLKVYLRDQDIRHDVLDAIFALDEKDLVSIASRAQALQSFLLTDDGANLAAGYKRAANILNAEAKKGDLPDDQINSTLLADKTEQALSKALNAAAPKITKLLGKEDYAGAMSALSKLRLPIDDFFENVMVNDEDPKIRANRLGLLIQIRKLAGQIADFDKLDG